MLTVRHPVFDLAGSGPHWGDNLEAVAIINAGAIIPSAIERYLIRVMRQAKALLDPVADADLIDTIGDFNKQEGQHLKLHAALLDMLCDTAYPGLRQFETAFAADLDDFLATKPLDWNLAYCEGFEATGCAMAASWVDGTMRDLCGDHGSEVMRMWMWHLAEEFEHRGVVHDVIERLHPDRAHELRTSGALFNRDHIAVHTLGAVAYIQEVDQASMDDDEVAASEVRMMRAAADVAAASTDQMTWVFEPGYDPSTVAPPRDYEAVLAYADPG